MRPIPGTAQLTVSHGGNSHPIFESATVAETKWRALFEEDYKALHTSDSESGASGWIVHGRISAMLTIGCRQLAHSTIVVANAIFSQSALWPVHAYEQMCLRMIDDPVSMARFIQGA